MINNVIKLLDFLKILKVFMEKKRLKIKNMRKWENNIQSNINILWNDDNSIKENNGIFQNT